MAVIKEVKEVEITPNTRTTTESANIELIDEVIFMRSEINNNTPIVSTLPPASQCKGQTKKFFCELAESYCNVEVVSGDEIRGNLNYPLSMEAVGEHCTLTSDGMSAWYLGDNKLSSEV
jgi:hypothetical protein